MLAQAVTDLGAFGGGGCALLLPLSLWEVMGASFFSPPCCLPSAFGWAALLLTPFGQINVPSSARPDFRPWLVPRAVIDDVT